MGRQTIPLEKIRRDGGTQTRDRIDSDTVESYADAMKSGAKFPEPVVFFDGEAYWLADGFHRVAAWISNGEADAECDVRQGDRRSAILFSVGANASHGLRRTNADKRRAVLLLLGDEEWAGKSDVWVAKACGVSSNFVGTLRPQPSSDEGSPRRVGQDGKTRKAPESRAPKAAKPPEEPRNAFQGVASAIASATTREEAGKAYTALGRAASALEVSPREAEELATAYQARVRAIDAGELADDDADVEPVLVVGDEPTPVPLRPEPEASRWGSFDVARTVNEILVTCRQTGELLREKFAAVDPRFAAEVRQRAQDGMIGLMQVVNELLPPDGSKAHDNRRRFGVVDGGRQ